MGTGIVLPVLFLLLGISQSWNIIPNISESSFTDFARNKISVLRNLRNSLQNHNVSSEAAVSSIRNTVGENKVGKEALNNRTSFFQLSNIGNSILNASLIPIISLDSVDSILKKAFLKQSRDGFLQQILPKKEFLKKISDFRDKLEPEVKRYLTNKYNSFLSNLVPYSETIGVPPYVLNSMKIPQNFDPRWQFIKSLLESSSNSNEEALINDLESSNVQGRSDDQDLVSDQEPDATDKGQKKYQHIYLRNRLNKQHYLVPDRTGYEISFDSIGPYESDSSYEGSTYSKRYNSGEHPYTMKNDMQAAAGSHGNSRGSHGHGHGGGHSSHGHGNGLVDPFTILGGLAFLTYLGLLIQRSLNGTAAGRSFADGDFRTFEHKIPVVLTKLFSDKHPDPPKQSRKTSHIFKSLDALGKTFNKLSKISDSKPTALQQQPQNKFCFPWCWLPGRADPRKNATNTYVDSSK